MLRCSLVLGLVLAQASPQAESLWHSGQRAAALDLMQAELEERPSDLELRASLVERELLVSRFEAALAHAEGLEGRGRAARGQALYFLGRYEEALPWLPSDDAKSVLLRAESLRALGRLEESEALLPSIAEHFGAEDWRYSLHAGRRALRLGEAQEAAARFRAVLSQQPLEAEAHFGLGRALLKGGDREGAMVVLQRHRELLPLLDALDFAQRGVALAPMSASNQAGLADALRALRSHSPSALAQAKAAYERALALASDAELVPVGLRAARLVAEDEGRPEEAADLLLGLLARTEDVRLRVRAADYLVAASQPERAREQLRAALSLRPGDRAIEARLRELEEAHR
jgi:tetratricopeptide (TPR) repeat protein